MKQKLANFSPFIFSKLTVDILLAKLTLLTLFFAYFAQSQLNRHSS